MFSNLLIGDLFVLFSSIPKDHSTWLYLQLSPSGVAFYQRMVLQKNEVGRSIGMLGDKALFETFFVCVGQEVGKNIRYFYTCLWITHPILSSLYTVSLCMKTSTQEISMDFK